MRKLLGKKNIKEPSKADKAIQTDNNDSYVRLLILEKLPKFTNPSDENFNHFIQRLQIIMQTFKINDDEKVGFLLATLQAPALEKLERSQLEINSNTSWNDATTMLKDIFDPLLTTGNIQQLRQSKQQHDQDFSEFTFLIQQLVHKIFTQQQGYTDAHREAETIRYTIRGANKKIKNQLKGTKYNSIADMIAKAKVVESNMHMME